MNFTWGILGGRERGPRNYGTNEIVRMALVVMEGLYPLNQENKNYKLENIMFIVLFTVQ